tara:strand:- start:122 stop:454 length:333 start_codon:yes stop_codon:yes gene_type:complete
MPTAEWMVEQVKEVYPNADIEATDTTGGGDHWFVRIVDIGFEGVRSFKRQKPVIQHFKPHIQTNYVHALDLKCQTPEEAEKSSGDEPFSPHEAKRNKFVGLQVRRTNKEE